MKLKTLAAAAALAIIVSAPAFAQQGGPGGFTPPTPEQQAAAFDANDKDKSGALDKVEFKATLPEQFQSQIDDARLDQMFGGRDADKDGKLSKAEFTAPRQRPAGGPGGGGRPPG